MNKQLIFDGVVLPYYESEDGCVYYPVKYTIEKILLKTTVGLHNNSEYKQFIKRFVIDFSFSRTSSQECYCMSKDGWIKYVNTTKFRKFNILQVKRHNLFCELIGSNSKQTLDYSHNNMNEYLNDCINEVLDSNPGIEFKSCTKCNLSFPLSNKFFIKNNKLKDGLSNSCKLCSYDNLKIIINDSYKYHIYKDLGIDAYRLYKSNIVEFYSVYCHDSEFTLNTDINTYLCIIKYYYINGLINREQLQLSQILNKFNFNTKIINSQSLNNNTLIKYCSDNECIDKPWLYKYYRNDILSIEDGIKIFNNYINSNEITIDNIFKFKRYEDLIRKSRLTQFLGGKSRSSWSLLEFIVQYYDNKYGGYKFSLGSKNYYKSKDNCIFDMKYFIENDLKVDISKIPLYVTKYSLSQRARPMYHSLSSNGYYNNLFDWINDCYPGRFSIEDFNINPFRSNFDSLEESQVYEQLVTRFKNVIYNPRNSDNTIIISGMIPDFIIHTDNGCYLVEYFGMYKSNCDKETSILYDYKIKTESKIKKYLDLEKCGYKHLFIFPDDIKNNFIGLHNKIDTI